MKHTAKRSGFIDPIAVLSRLSAFAQPSEVEAPVELLRAGAIFHARGLINSRVIQHNLDWIWPFWVARQYNPRDESFIPRSFSLTQVNLTQRNWTSVGIPDVTEIPIVDPRGLITPFHDSWSVEGWIIDSNGGDLIPSRVSPVDQHLSIDDGLAITTQHETEHATLVSEVLVRIESGKPVLIIRYTGKSSSGGRLVVSLRPFNPEGISFIHSIETLPDGNGWTVNKEKTVSLDSPPGNVSYSRYHDGDVYHRLARDTITDSITCDVGMASAAAAYTLDPGKERALTVRIPLADRLPESVTALSRNNSADTWHGAVNSLPRLSLPDRHFTELYGQALRTLLLMTPGNTVFAGPFTYKRFWFRDAAFIVHALIRMGHFDRAERIIDRFPELQKSSGYFSSQEGEWDSNGQVLWLIREWLRYTNKKPKKSWIAMVRKAAEWVCKKRMPDSGDSVYSGLLPPGFSAEHLGPNDYYYWDDFWSCAGLYASADILEKAGHETGAARYRTEAQSLGTSIERSLVKVSQRNGTTAMPASPSRRLDSGAVGSLAAGYPLYLWNGRDPRLLATAEYLLGHCLVHGAFFHDIVHSGINAYLTIHIAQVLLRAGDNRFFDLMGTIASMASPTGQWPEAIHPKTGGGCMGDGQHVWAAAEWIHLVRNCFVFEETGKRTLILCAGITSKWLKPGEPLFFGKAPTAYGSVSVSVESEKGRVRVSWDADWHDEEPLIEVRFPGQKPVPAHKGQNSVTCFMNEAKR